MVQILILLLFIGGGLSQQINFNGNPTDVSENSGKIIFELVASVPVVADTYIGIKQLGTATAAAGYDFGGSVAFNVTMTTGTTRHHLIFSIYDDALVELAETIELEITMVTGGAIVGAERPVATATILADAGDTDRVRVDFQKSQYVTDEQNSSVTVVLQFTDPDGQPTVLNGPATDTASFILPTSGSTDTATRGVDFADPTSAAINFPVDKTSTTLSQTIGILDDSIEELTEDFILSLTAFTAGTFVELGTTRPVTNILIRDNDFSSPCHSTPCLNNGTCFESDRSFLCTCVPEYSGPTCNVLPSPCQSTPCLNNGTCFDSETSFVCTCVPEYSGPTCNDLSSVDNTTASLPIGIIAGSVSAVLLLLVLCVILIVLWKWLRARRNPSGSIAATPNLRYVMDASQPNTPVDPASKIGPLPKPPEESSKYERSIQHEYSVPETGPGPSDAGGAADMPYDDVEEPYVTVI